MNDEPEEMGIPEWVVTFGDMMSLLLTFFIMLVSLSEIKDDETYQKLVDSVQREFGYSRSSGPCRQVKNAHAKQSSLHWQPLVVPNAKTLRKAALLSKLQQGKNPAYALCVLDS